MGTTSFVPLVTALLLLGAACGDAADPAGPASRAATSAPPLADTRPAPAVAAITCEDGAVRVAQPLVAAQPDGVHLSIDNRDGGDRIVWVRSPGRQVTETAPPGASSAVVSSLPPGTWALLCSPASIYPGNDAPGTALEVLDPAGHWVDDSLGCEHPTHSHPDYEEYFTGGTPTGEPGDPRAIAEAEVGSWFAVRPGDIVEPAGYPDASPRMFRVVRDGSALALARYASDGQGGWYFGSVEYCE